MTPLITTPALEPESASLSLCARAPRILAPECLICAHSVFLASTSVGYAFNSAKGDIAGAAVVRRALIICNRLVVTIVQIGWTLLAIFSAQRHPGTIHVRLWRLLSRLSPHLDLTQWVALGAFIVSALAVVKALATTFRSGSVLEDTERAPLISGDH